MWVGGERGAYPMRLSSGMWPIKKAAGTPAAKREDPGTVDSPCRDGMQVQSEKSYSAFNCT